MWTLKEQRRFYCCWQSCLYCPWTLQVTLLLLLLWIHARTAEARTTIISAATRARLYMATWSRRPWAVQGHDHCHNMPFLSLIAIRITI
jgi:hypothetical protein